MPSDPVTYYTALHIAVLRNQPDMVELLVRHGADINRRDRVRAGPACSEAGTWWGGGHEQLPRPPGQLRCALLSQIHESSPLDLASEEPERLPCLQRLLDLGADVNAADKHGGCPRRESGTAVRQVPRAGHPQQPRTAARWARGLDAARAMTQRSGRTGASCWPAAEALGK